MRRFFCKGLLGLALLCLAGVTGADTLITRDGKTLEGVVVKEEANRVTFRYYLYGSPIEKTIDKAEILSLKKGQFEKPAETDQAEDTEDADAQADADAPPDPGPPPQAPPIRAVEGVRYCVVPLHGVVGQTITADLLEQSLADAALRDPTVIVLDIDSPGGLIAEVPRLAEVVGRYRDRHRLVVFVREAMSAAAITALGVEEIIVRPGSRFGAATAWRVGPRGLPTAIDEKFQSAWRATARSMAEMGRHDPELAEAMIDATIELTLTRQDGRPTIVKGSPRPGLAGPPPKVISQKGQLLTLTSGEAVACGLADGQAKNLEQLGTVLGLPGWTRLDGLAEPLAQWQAAKIKRAAWELKQLTDRFQHNVRKAQSVDPRKSQYKVLRGSKAFTPASRARWVSRTRAALSYLQRAEKDLEAIEALIKDTPELLVPPEVLRQAREEIETYRNRLNTERDQQGRR